MRRAFLLVVLAAALPATVLADPIYTKPGIPDVDKPDRDGDGDWPDDDDNSCWIATASNLLGAAGYGSGADAQARAQSIYNTLAGQKVGNKWVHGDIGWKDGGYIYRALNYWLYEYGKNPDKPEFDPDNQYTDVRVVFDRLTKNDYKFLINELKRCQTVGLRGYWDAGGAHAITLVGNQEDGTSKTIIHDSDNDLGGSDDDYHDNSFGTGDVWDLVWGEPGEEFYQRMDGYVTLCPGLNKPEYAVRNYDLAYYLKPENPGEENVTWKPGFREAGAKKDKFDNDPFWDSDTELVVYNEPVPNAEKRVWLLVDYTDRVDTDRAPSEPVKLVDDKGNEHDPTKVTASKDNGQLLFYWELDYQPAFEKIKFPSNKYRYLTTGNVKDWNVSTWCTPEPFSMAFVGSAFAGVIVLARRRRQRDGARAA